MNKENNNNNNCNKKTTNLVNDAIVKKEAKQFKQRLIM